MIWGVQVDEQEFELTVSQFATIRPAFFLPLRPQSTILGFKSLSKPNSSFFRAATLSLCEPAHSA